MVPLIGGDAFQEVDAVGVTRPIVKHNFLIKNVEDIALTMKKAFHLATTGRPGPVVVDVPKDITAQITEYVWPDKLDIRSYPAVPDADPEQVKKAVDALLRARRPVIYSGGGVLLSNAEDELIKLVRLLGYPCTNTLMGLGAYPHDDPLFIGMLGMHGTYESNMAMHDADLILSVGARFDDRITGETSTFAPNATIVHIDIDPAQIGKNITTQIPLVGDAKQVLQAILAGIRKTKAKPEKTAIKQWWKIIDGWRAKNSYAYDNSSTDIIKPQYVVQKLHQVTGGEAFVTSDVGQHQMFAAQFYGFNKTRRWINSGGLGTMGFGLPAAMGVKVAHPDADVACVTGEGSIVMCIQELSTCKQHDLPIKIINLNNRYLGMVRQWQEFFYDSRYSHSYMDSLPDFTKLAEAYGHVGMQITKPSDVEGALKEAFAMTDRLVFMDFITDQKENVYPMIAAGKPHNEMHLRPESELGNPDLENSDLISKGSAS
ncbi:MAG: biosynthetic-type acetolactate synthase large subunit, partial [Proteobacteria bacterium]|nr:biosynthetic-type acetolactate synthase large subunit [Pseudomonadota bacterium]